MVARSMERRGSTPPDRRTLSFGSSATPLPMGPEDRLHFRRVQGSLMANLVAGAGQATHDAFCCYCGAQLVMVLTSVEHVVSKVLHLKDCGVRSASERSLEMRLDNFADDDVVIPLLNNGCYTTFDRTGSIDKNRSSGFALTE